MVDEQDNVDASLPAEAVVEAQEVEQSEVDDQSNEATLPTDHSPSHEEISAGASASTEQVVPNEVELKLDQVLTLISDRLSYDEAKDEVIRRQADELAALRDDLMGRQIRPLLLDLVFLYDSLRTIRRDLSEQDQLSGDYVDSRLDNLSDELLESLARQEVRAYTEKQPNLDRKRHRTLAVEPTEEKHENDQIARIIRRGFTWGDTVLRPEEVAVKRFQSGPNIEE